MLKILILLFISISMFLGSRAAAMGDLSFKELKWYDKIIRVCFYAEMGLEMVLLILIWWEIL